MRRVLALLFPSLFTPTVASVTAPLTKMVTDLNAIQRREVERIESLHEQVKAAAAERDAALVALGQLNTIFPTTTTTAKEDS